jgi:uncharacterized lipoprotein YddW (UPF0748 family)
MTAALLTALLAQTENRFDLAYPLPNLAPVRIDKIGSGFGIAQQTARAYGFQVRMLWVDATANMASYNTPEKVDLLMARAKRSGFNTVVFDSKPIVGYTMYPSAFSAQLTQWRNVGYAAGYDPMAEFVRAARANGLTLYTCFNAFSEGHRIAKESSEAGSKEFFGGKAGIGWDKPEEQSVQYTQERVLNIGNRKFIVAPRFNPRSVDILNRTAIYQGKPDVEGSAIVVGPDRKIRRVFNNEATHRNERIVLFPKSLALTTGDLEKMVGLTADLAVETGFMRSGEFRNQIPLMMNPFHPNVWQRTMEHAREVVQKYDIDGLLYDDRLRYTGMDGDFSPLTRELFEKKVGQKLSWPDDVFSVSNIDWDLKVSYKPGRFWDAWWAFRAQRMQDLVRAIRTTIKKEKPSVKLGIYAGAWYGEYDSYGANYGSSDNNVGFTSMTRSYRRTGFASDLDIFIAGCYYTTPTIHEAMTRGVPEGTTIEAGAQLANRAINDATWTISGIALDQFFSNPKRVEDALQAATAASQGVMVFDYSHRFELFEGSFQKAFAKPAKSPVQIPGLLDQVRKRKAQLKGQDQLPVFIQPGAPGVGH